MAPPRARESTGSTLAPPPSFTPRPRARVAQPAGLRPAPNATQFPFRNLLRLPARVFYPPSLQAEAAAEKVGSATRTELREVQLADVLAGKYLSPLSLKDFEGHLVFRERSCENLYFILWLNEYQKEWNTYQAANPTQRGPHSAVHLPANLYTSLQAGLEAFFAPNARLELNLSSTTRDKTLVEAAQSGSPSDFRDARDVVEMSLQRSLSAHKKAAIANAGGRRLALCACMGMFMFLLGFVPALVAIFGDLARGIRVIGLPFIALGAALVSMAPRRICFAVWALGSDRQLLPWEMKAPSVTSGTLVALTCPSTPRSKSPSADEEHDLGDEWEEDDRSFATATSATPYPWENEKVGSPSSPTFSQTASFPPHSPTLGSSRPLRRDSAAPSSYTPKGDYSQLNGSIPAWAPVCQVYAPEVQREHWKIVRQGFLIGAVTAVVLGAVLLAVPNA
ncbi:hypothetical protein BCR35DRAFT_301726 [Leucosporidium creatinivorum]|uniref:RGS domain-containing protein n=1 Tax=Leucosporidium creatinivorum TaxID=106004 RepID=A0A1Y2FW51_9BASI|nr:hypothetical protein BCR35DRAFT_301726 [Leucosporidium creatinivorum]